jgi:hypothetical protein
MNFSQHRIHHDLGLGALLAFALHFGRGFAFGSAFWKAFLEIDRASAHGTPQDHAWAATSRINSFFALDLY